MTEISHLPFEPMIEATNKTRPGAIGGRRPARVVQLDPAPHRLRRFRSHALHQGVRIWRNANACGDLWIELLNSYGFDPCAALSFTVMQDFEGDQFTLFKFPHVDLDNLYGLQVQELAIYDSLEERLSAQTQRDNTVIMEVDGFYLPDMKGTWYRSDHVKTTIGIDYINTRTRQLGYFHNAGYFFLYGKDYDGVLHRLPEFYKQSNLLLPYVEFSKRIRPALEGTTLAEASADLLIVHLARRPASNPIDRWRSAFPGHMDTILERGNPYLQLYAFNLMQQLGANFQYLAKYLDWMRTQGFDIPTAISAAAQKIASEAMMMKFRVARANLDKRTDLCDDCFDVLAASYDQTIGSLDALIG